MKNFRLTINNVEYNIVDQKIRSWGVIPVSQRGVVDENTIQIVQGETKFYVYKVNQETPQGRAEEIMDFKAAIDRLNEIRRNSGTSYVDIAVEHEGGHYIFHSYDKKNYKFAI